MALKSRPNSLEKADQPSSIGTEALAPFTN
jgi:hypothetical protein